MSIYFCGGSCTPGCHYSFDSGDLEGTQQSGMAFDLKIANIARDGQLVQLARNEAQVIIDNDLQCNASQNALLWNRLRELKKTNINWAAIS